MVNFFATSRQQAGRITAAALEYTAPVVALDVSGDAPGYLVQFDDAVVMNADELAAVLSATV